MKALFSGCLPPPYHGQSVAFDVLRKLEIEDSYFVDINFTGLSFFSKLIKMIRVFFYLIYFFVVKSKKIDIAYFTCSRSFSGSLRDVLLLLFAKLFSVPVVNHLHGADFKSFYYSLPAIYRSFLKWCYRNVRCCIVLCDGMKCQFAMFPWVDTRVVNNFFSNDLILNDDVNRFELGGSNLNFLYLSNIMESKGIFLLLDAFEIVARQHPNIRLLIAGDFVGDYISDAHSVRKRFKDLTDNKSFFKYCGVVSGKQKVSLLNSCSVFVLPTFHRSEAVPISLIEAMAAGCAVICTKHNFVHQIVNPMGCVIVEAKSCESLVAGLNYYIENISLIPNHSLSNKQFARSNFSESLFLKSILEVLIDYGR